MNPPTPTQALQAKAGKIRIGGSFDSSSWITDASGAVNQHLQYLPFGEDYIYQRSNSWNIPYTFSGKEKDDETGYSYFGARYYDSDISVWLSVDPLSDKYPSMSAYMYTAGNPVMLVDPDGRKIKFIKYKNLDDTEKKGITRSEYNERKRLVKKSFRQGRKESNTFQTIYNDLNDDDKTYSIKVNKKGDNSYTTGSKTISIDPDRKAPGLEGYDKKMSIIDIAAHELGHAWRDLKGLDPKQLSFPKNPSPELLNVFFSLLELNKSISEEGACHIENMVRSEISDPNNNTFLVTLPLRQDYAGYEPKWYDINRMKYNYHQKHDLYKFYQLK